ncbi:hypothetical protein J6TS1_17080 [Siminovitchia terrae]|uniref:Uncharacterized protein n=1 Tax=Siminovitchia terrae TaxID=1914933 RepID=A0ABQ4KUX1_SIMTE|nr:hypothetical protein J6TS1_17080 [Siminovitchia terrae]
MKNANESSIGFGAWKTVTNPIKCPYLPENEKDGTNSFVDIKLIICPSFTRNLMNSVSVYDMRGEQM